MSSKEFNKYKYLTGDEVLPSNQKQIIEQTKLTYSPLGKAFKKQIKTIKDQEEKQIKLIKQPTSFNDYENKWLISKEIKYLRISITRNLIK